MTGDAWEEYRDGEINLDTLKNRVEDERVSQRTYGYIPGTGWEVKEWHAFAINKIGLALLIVAFLLMAPEFTEDWKAKKALENDLEEMGCSALLKHSGPDGNFSLKGQASGEWFQNVSDNPGVGSIEPEPPDG